MKRFIMIFVVMLFMMTSAFAIDKTGANAPEIYQGLYPVKYVEGVAKITNVSDPEWYNYAEGKWANAVTLDKLGQMNPAQATEDNITGYYVWVPRYAYMIRTGYNSSETGRIDIKFLKGTTNKDNNGKEYYTVDDFKNQSNRWEELNTITYIGDRQMDYLVHPAFKFDEELAGIWVGKSEASKGIEQEIELVNTIPNDALWTSVNINSSFEAIRDMTSVSRAYDKYNLYGLEESVNPHLIKATEYGAVVYLDNSIYGDNAETSIYRVDGIDSVKEYIAGALEGTLELRTDKYLDIYTKDEEGNIVDIKGSGYLETSDGTTAWNNETINDLTDENGIIVKENAYGTVATNGEATDVGFRVVLTKGKGDINNIKESYINGKSYYWLMENGDVWVMGDNSSGQLGLADTSYRYIPEKLEYDSEGNKIPKIIKKYSGNVYLSEEGKVYVSGTNDYGQLGIGTTDKYVYTLTKLSSIPENEKIIDIYTAWYQNYFFTESGKIYASGNNSYGQLGVGITDKKIYTAKEVLLPEGEIIKKKIIGNSMIFLMESGKVYACGDNASGYLGVTNTATKVYALEEVTALGGVLIDDISNAYYLGKNGGAYKVNKAQKLEGLDGVMIREVAGDSSVVCFISNDGKVYDNSGTLVSGLEGITIKDIEAIDSTNGEFFFLPENGGLYGFGRNSGGQLGVGSSDSTITSAMPVVALQNKKIKKIAKNSFKTYILTEEGEVYVCGEIGDTSTNAGTFNTAKKETGLNGIKVKDLIPYGWSYASHVYYLTEDGEVYVCGANDDGQLGIGDKSSYSKITKIKSLEGVVIEKIICNGGSENNYTYFISDKGEIYVSGYNGKGQLGPEFKENQVNIATKAEFLISINFKEYKDGYFYTYDNKIYNAYTGKQLDVLTLENSRKKIKDIVTDGSGTWYITEEGEVYVSGYNLNGRFGIGSLANPNVVTRVDALAGKIIERIIIRDYSTWYLTNKGELYACGYNGYSTLSGRGFLGIGSTEESICTPTRVGEDKDLLFKDVISYANSTWFITVDDDIYASGFNDGGRLGVGSGREFFKATIIPELSGKDIKDIVFSTKEPNYLYNVYYLMEDGSVYGSGKNDYGEFGLGKKGSKNKPVKLTAFDGIPIKEVKAYGQNANSVYFLTKNNELYVTGYNNYGQLGVGGTDSVMTPKKILDNVIKIASYYYAYEDRYAINSNMYFLTSQGEVYVCGNNNYGQLGMPSDKDTTNITTVTKIDTLSSVVVEDIVFDSYKAFFIGYDTITNKNVIYACGYNTSGQLGVKDRSNKSTPTKIAELEGIKIKKIFADSTTITRFLTDAGEVYACGDNTSGALGVDSADKYVTKPMKVKKLEGIIIKDKIGSYFISDENEIYSSVGDKITGLDEKGVSDITARGALIYAITDDGEVYGYSDSGKDALGIGHSSKIQGFVRLKQTDNTFSSLENTNSIYGNSTSTIFEQDNGDIYVLGDNSNNKLGITGKIDVPTKISLRNIKDAGIGSDFSVFLKDDGSIVGYGNQSKNGKGLNNIAQIAVGDNKAYFMRHSGIVIDSQSNIITGDAYKIAAGANHLVVLKKDGTTEVFGQANSGLTNVIDIFAGKNMTVYITNDNKTYIMEENTLTELSIKNIVYAELNGTEPYFLTYDRNLIDKNGNAIKLEGANLNLVKEVKGDIVLNERMKVYDLSKF